jgi:hypothetical protein
MNGLDSAAAAEIMLSSFLFKVGLSHVRSTRHVLCRRDWDRRGAFDGESGG